VIVPRSRLRLAKNARGRASLLARRACCITLFRPDRRDRRARRSARPARRLYARCKPVASRLNPASAPQPPAGAPGSGGAEPQPQPDWAVRRVLYGNDALYYFLRFHHHLADRLLAARRCAAGRNAPASLFRRETAEEREAVSGPPRPPTHPPPPPPHPPHPPAAAPHTHPTPPHQPSTPAVVEPVFWVAFWGTLLGAPCLVKPLATKS
jgi:hypothetical protein